MIKAQGGIFGSVTGVATAAQFAGSNELISLPADCSGPGSRTESRREAGAVFLAGNDRYLVAGALKHDPEKWTPVFGKIMRKQMARAG